MSTEVPTRYPSAEWRPVVNTRGAMVTPTRGMIPHVALAAGSLFAQFNNPMSLTSSHLWLSADGRWQQYVPLDRRAWAQAAGNPYWISVECAGFDDQDYSVAQIEQLGRFYAWGMTEFGWRREITDSVDGYGIGTHRMGGKAWGNHSCPGEIRAGRRADILAAASAFAGPVRYDRMPTARLSASTAAPVVELQNGLNIALGHEAATDRARLAPDGVYGPLTRAAVLVFQRLDTQWCGPIEPDGVAGPVTWRKLAIVLTGLNRWV